MVEVMNAEERNKEKFSYWKKISILFAVVIAGVILYLGVKENNFSLIASLLSIAGVCIALLIFFSWNKLLKKFNMLNEEKNDKEKLPQSVTQDEIMELIKSKVEDPMRYCNHIRSWGEIFSREVGKNLIYVFDIEFEYYDKRFGERAFVIVNSHFPKQFLTFMRTDTNARRLNQAINMSSTNPEKDPEKEIIEERNMLTGSERKITTTKPHTKNKTQEETKPTEGIN